MVRTPIAAAALALAAASAIQEIAGDRVIIARPEGLLEVLLQDPAKPREVAPAPAAP